MKIFPVVILSLFLLVSSASADLEISGFFDVLYQDLELENSSSGLGAFELDYSNELSEGIVFEGAVVLEGDEIGLGATFIDFTIIKDLYSIQAGLIDVPFGIDREVFATPDRKLITPPLTTEIMMLGGWGDIGVNFSGKYSILNFNIYLVNGFGEEFGIPVTQLSDNNNARTFGFRLGVTPIAKLELGLSYGSGPYLDDNSDDNSTRTGIDFKFDYLMLKLKAEYIMGKEDIPLFDTFKHEGFYFQILGNINPSAYAILRYGTWKPEGFDEFKRITFGLGYDYRENISFRGEVQMNKETPTFDNDLYSLQVVVSF